MISLATTSEAPTPQLVPQASTDGLDLAIRSAKSFGVMPIIVRPLVSKLSVQTIGMASRDWIAEHRTVPDELESAWQTTVDAALAAATRLFDECTELRPLRLHGDCHPGNVLWTDDGPHFVDLDDAATGPAMQDLWMLLSGDRAAMARQLAVLLSGYDAFAEFNRHELRLVEALRTLRMIHHSAWLAQRWSDPAFPAAFPWFASSSYWSQQISQLREQLEAMAQPPLSLPSRR